MSAYQDYLNDLNNLLHDANNQFWTLAQKIVYINNARLRVVRDTGCYRVLQPGYISPSLEVFPFGGVTGVNLTNAGTGYSSSFAVTFTGGGGTGAAGTATATAGVIQYVTITNAGSGYTTAPTPVFTAGGGASAAGTVGIIPAGVFDVVNLNVYWGQSRRSLGYLPWSEFNAKYRYYVSNPGTPAVWSVYSANSVFLRPIANQVYQCEWDTVVAPPDIVDTSSTEVIPPIFRDPVGFYAAYKAKLKQQAWGEANEFMKQYNGQIMAAINSSYTRRTPNPYAP